MGSHKSREGFEMTQDEALKLLKPYKMHKQIPFTGMGEAYEVMKAQAFIEGYEQGVKIGYEQGRNTNGEKTYEDGVRESAKVLDADILDQPDEFEPKIKLKVFDIVEKIQRKILAFLEKKCTCGENSPDNLVVHRTDGPCYLREKK